MKIAVLVKRVADSEKRVKVGADGKAIDPAGVQYVINPYDEIAVEQALQLKAKAGGEVIIVCLGPKDSTKEIRKALAMTADSAVLLVDAQLVAQRIEGILITDIRRGIVIISGGVTSPVHRAAVIRTGIRHTRVFQVGGTGVRGVDEILVVPTLTGVLVAGILLYGRIGRYRHLHLAADHDQQGKVRENAHKSLQIHESHHRLTL